MDHIAALVGSEGYLFAMAVVAVVELVIVICRIRPWEMYVEACDLPWPQPCPGWCAARHRVGDLVDDRLHFSSWLRFVALPAASPVVTGDGTRYVRQLMVYVEQHVSEDTPRVILTEEHGGQEELRLSAEEAVQLGAALVHGGSMISRT